MKLKAIVAVCALAFAGQAFAVGPTPAQAAASTVQLFVSGSSALQNSVGQIANGLFAAGTLTVFKDENNGKDFRAYAGTFAATAPGGLAGKTGILYNTAKGGSFAGVIPVATAGTVGKINMTTCGAAATGTDGVTGAPVWTCPSNTTNAVVAVPDAGLADVEPALFTGINVPAGTAAVTPAMVAALTTTSSLAVPMGIIVNPASLVTDLTKPQVTSVMAGVVPDFSLIVPTAKPGNLVVCRRVAGSGTQAAINASFFGYPCSSAQQVPATYASTSAVTGVTVIENSSSGALAACMAAAQLGTKVGGWTINITNGTIANTGTVANPTGVDATHITLAAGTPAIGLMGVDRPAATVKNNGINGSSADTVVGGVVTVPGVAVSESYNFISIGGVAPTNENASTGLYDVVVNNSWNKRTGIVAGIAPLALDQLAFYDALVAKSGDPLILGPTKVPAMPGVLALANVPYDPTPTVVGGTILANPVMRVSKANTCQPAAQIQ